MESLKFEVASLHPDDKMKNFPDLVDQCKFRNLIFLSSHMK